MRAHSPGGRSRGGRVSAVVRRPWTLPAAASCVGQRLGDRPARRRRRVPRRGHPAGRGRRRSHPGRVPPRAPPAGALRPRSGPGDRRRRDPGPAQPAHVGRRRVARPSGGYASTMVRHPVHRQRWACSARSTAAVAPAPTPFARRPSRRTMMPGVQKPHWLAPVAQKASAQRARTCVGQARRWSSPIARPPGAAGSRTRPGRPRRPARCNSRTGPGGCTRPWPTDGEMITQRIEQGPAVVGDLDLPTVDADTLHDRARRTGPRGDGSRGTPGRIGSPPMQPTPHATAQPTNRPARRRRRWPAPASWPRAARLEVGHHGGHRHRPHPGRRVRRRCRPSSTRPTPTW